MDLLKSPFFQVCFWLFVTHQFLQKVAHVKLGILDSYLDPLLCLPLLLSFLLMERRWLLQSSQYVLPVSEVFLITVTVSVLCEIGFPYWSNHFTADVLDVVAYGIGAMAFHVFQNHPFPVREQLFS